MSHYWEIAAQHIALAGVLWCIGKCGADLVDVIEGTEVVQEIRLWLNR